MADETPPQSTGRQPGQPAPTPLPAYDWLRWAIRITGIVLMFGGTIYLGMVASDLLTGGDYGGGLFVVVVSLVMLGLGIFVLRIGLNMLRSIDAHTIGSFSLVFSLIYTWILAQILPFARWFGDYTFVSYLLMFLSCGLSYWVLKRILFHLLLPPSEK